MLYISPETMAMLRGPLAASIYLRNKPVTLAGSQPKPKTKTPKLARARYDRILDSAVTILKQGQYSKFEFEGPIRHGVRSTLCAEGWRWHHADAIAGEIVGKALDRIGAVRPTYDQGQHEYTYEGLVLRTRCVRCGTQIPEERLEHRGGYGVRFCDDVCSRSEASQRQYHEHMHRSRAEWLAHSAARSEMYRTIRTKECAQCGTDFVSESAGHEFCSLACKGLASRVYKERACEVCDTVFLPKKNPHGVQRYCSKECSSAGMWEARRSTMACDDLGRVQMVPREDRTCVVCSTAFRPKFPSDPKRTCSTQCQYRLRSMSRWGVKL